MNSAFTFSSGGGGGWQSFARAYSAVQRFLRNLPLRAFSLSRGDLMTECLRHSTIFLRSIFYKTRLVSFKKTELLFVHTLPLRVSNDAYISRAFIATFLRDLLQLFHANFARGDSAPLNPNGVISNFTIHQLRRLFFFAQTSRNEPRTIIRVLRL